LWADRTVVYIKAANSVTILQVFNFCNSLSQQQVTLQDLRIFPTNFKADIRRNAWQKADLNLWWIEVQMIILMDTNQHTSLQIKKRRLAGQLQNMLKHDIGRWQRVMDFLLPPRCVLCGMSSGSSCICDPCRIDLPWTGLHCDQCGLPLASSKDKICGQCINNTPPFTHTVCPLQYQFPADRLVQSFKFNRQLTSGRILSRLMCEYIIEGGLHYPDTLIPVPLHNLRMLRRGFNQACELGSHISKTLDIPLLKASLRRRRNTKAQSGLSRKQRRNNVHGAFYWHDPDKPARHVALIDDVMTTGTTVTECARVLKKAGAKRVDIWVATRAIPAKPQ
jgi:ComF family protein